MGMEGRISNPTRYDQLQQFAAVDKERIADLDAALEKTKGQKH